MKFSDQIRRQVKMSGHSQYFISKATKIDKSALSRFMLGKAGLGVQSLDRLADFLKLKVVGTKKRR